MNHSTVYAKTAAGQAEVAQRSARLSMVERRLLILTDGQRSLGELSAMLPPGSVESCLEVLLRQQLLSPVTATPSAAHTAPEPEVLEVPTVNGAAPERAQETALTLDAAKRLAVRELFARLGPDADQLARHIDASRSAEDFRARAREAARTLSADRGAAAGQDYLRALGLE